jgi:hypothetical protein
MSVLRMLCTRSPLWSLNSRFRFGIVVLVWCGGWKKCSALSEGLLLWDIYLEGLVDRPACFGEAIEHSQHRKVGWNDIFKLFRDFEVKYIFFFELFISESSSSIKMATTAIEASNLFNVKGLVAVITGGGSGLYFIADSEMAD